MDYEKGVAVIGGGSAGIAAALSAAKCGANVYLFEKTDILGGTVVHSLIHTLGGIFNSSGDFINEGLSIELSDRLLKASSLTRKRKIGRTWTLSVCPEVYKKVITKWIDEKSGIKVFYKSKVIKVKIKNYLVAHIELDCLNEPVALEPISVIDATGSASVVRGIDPELVVDNAGQAGGMIFQMQGVEPDTLKFPKGINFLRSIRRAAQEKKLPKECEMAWLDTGIYEDEVYVKLFVPLSKNWQDLNVMEETVQKSEKARDKLVEFLSSFPGFSKAKVTQTGKIGIRCESQIKGDYCLTEADVLNERKFQDAACRCSWPIEYWDTEKGVEVKYLSSGGFYEIPLKSLKVKKIKNLWTAGKSLSAEPRAQASARVVGSCWAMGESAGKAAVESI